MPIRRWETRSSQKVSAFVDNVYKCVALTLAREFGNMAGKLEEYEKLLRELSLRVNEPDQILISKAIEKVCILDFVMLYVLRIA